MRILHVIENLGAGGKERQIVEMLGRLFPHRDIKSFVAVMSEPVRYEIDGEHVQIIPLVRKSRTDLRPFKRLYELASDLKIDIVHSWGPMCSIYAAPVAKLCSLAFVNGFVRDAPPHMTLRNKTLFKGQADYSIFRHCCRQFACGPSCLPYSRAQRCMYLQWV